jgi:hypothetical protein
MIGAKTLQDSYMRIPNIEEIARQLNERRRKTLQYQHLQRSLHNVLRRLIEPTAQTGHWPMIRNTALAARITVIRCIRKIRRPQKPHAHLYLIQITSLYIAVLGNKFPLAAWPNLTFL